MPDYPVAAGITGIYTNLSLCLKKLYAGLSLAHISESLLQILSCEEYATLNSSQRDT